MVMAITIMLSLCFPIKAAEEVLKGRCHMDACSWMRPGVPEIVHSGASGTLKKLKMTSGSSMHPNGSYDKRAPIEWDAPHDEYVFCSKRHPAVIFSSEGKWLAHLLAPGYPDGVYGYNESDYVQYFKICHKLVWSYTKDASVAEKLGYPRYLVKSVDQIKLVKPEDIMALPDYEGGVELVDYHWRKGGFDNVMIATFTIENDSHLPIKDINISCELTGESGTVLGHTSNTIYQLVPANAHKTVSDFNMGLIHSQAVRAYCKLVTFKKVT
jgi:hypothetical protein